MSPRIMSPSNPMTPKKNSYNRFQSPDSPNPNSKKERSPFSPMRLLGKGDHPVFSIMNNLKKTKPELEANSAWDLDSSNVRVTHGF